MKVEAIVYSSMTGDTAQYAKMLQKKTGVKCCMLDEAVQKLPARTRVVYMSWLMAGTPVDYKKAAERFEVAAVCAVGLNATSAQAESTAKKLPADMPLFMLPGGYHPQQLRGMYKVMMQIVTRLLIKKISASPDRGKAEEEMLNVLKQGGSFVKEENLSQVLAFMQE